MKYQSYLTQNQQQYIMKNKENIFKTLDDIRDFSLTVVDTMVNQQLIKDCTDTDDDTEFSIQDIITEELCNKFNIEFE